MSNELKPWKVAEELKPENMLSESELMGLFNFDVGKMIDGSADGVDLLTDVDPKENREAISAAQRKQLRKAEQASRAEQMAQALQRHAESVAAGYYKQTDPPPDVAKLIPPPKYL